LRLAALSASPSAVGCKLPAASSPLFLVFYLLASDF